MQKKYIIASFPIHTNNNNNNNNNNNYYYYYYYYYEGMMRLFRSLVVGFIFYLVSSCSSLNIPFLCPLVSFLGWVIALLSTLLNILRGQLVK